jgi:hypothetical protein
METAETSAMPIGLEASINQQQMADLLYFFKHRQIDSAHKISGIACLFKRRQQTRAEKQGRRGTFSDSLS